MIRLRRRARLRRHEVEELCAGLRDHFGADAFAGIEAVDSGEVSDDVTVFLVGGEILALRAKGQATLTVRGLLRWPATRRWVTVDMGAVPYVYNGADVMAPGIVDADRAIAAGDPVWIRDEKNLRPLAVGEALMPGPEMAVSEKGKAVRSVQHVGDDYWKYGEEEEKA